MGERCMMHVVFVVVTIPPVMPWRFTRDGEEKTVLEQPDYCSKALLPGKEVTLRK